MRKVICLYCILLIVTTIFSCSLNDKDKERNNYPTRREENTETKKNNYKDGTYTEEGDKWKYGNENATVIISSGRITGITLRRLDVNGKEIRYEDWNGKNMNGSTKPNLNSYRIDLAQRMLEKQSFNVEIISGATLSSNNWKRAVQRALEKSTR